MLTDLERFSPVLAVYKGDQGSKSDAACELFVALLAALRMKEFWKKITSRSIDMALDVRRRATHFQFTPNNPWNDRARAGVSGSPASGLR
jgi:hypothetical protein